MSRAYYSECPCKDCSDRQVGCHGKCDKYQGWLLNSCEEPRKEWIGYSHVKQTKKCGKKLKVEVD